MSRVPLPQPLTVGPWSVAVGAEYGLSSKRLRGDDLARPFHGVRSPRAARTAAELAIAYFRRPRPGQLVVGPLAAQLWGLPLPRHLVPLPDGDLEIATRLEQNPPRGRGVRGRRVRSDLVRSDMIDGIPVASPELTLLSVANRCTTDELATMCDAVVTDSDLYPGRRLSGRPLLRLPELAAFAERAGAATGGRGLRQSVEHAREHVESPRESILRLRLTRSGLPEPEIAYEVTSRGSFVARLDLAYPLARLGVEYDGEQHGTDPEQWKRDIQRIRALECLGWRIIRVTSSDLYPDARALVRVVTSALAVRTHTLPAVGAANLPQTVRASEQSHADGPFGAEKRARSARTHGARDAARTRGARGAAR